MNDKQSLNLTPPRVSTLPDIPGGETNLLPLDATYTDLKVEFDQWPSSDPRQGTETVRLYWNDRDVAHRDWNDIIAPGDLYVMLPLIHLYHGVHQLHYKVRKWDGNEELSDPVTVTIDTLAPRLAGTNDPLQLPGDLVGNHVTARYLKEHDNILAVTVPAYDPQTGGPRPGDVLNCYWETSPEGQLLIASKTLTQEDMSLLIEIDGDVIVARGDGDRYATYLIVDRAGNRSSLSRPQLLQVNTMPVHRQLPRPLLNGTQTTTLDPFLAINGVTMVVPAEAVLDDTDEITMQWGEPARFGSWRTDTASAPRQYSIPASQVPPHMDGTVPVYYDVLDTDNVFHPSAPLTLRVSAVDGVPALQCDGISGGQISIREVEAHGGSAHCQIGSWPFMSMEQFITVKAVGIGTDNLPLTVTIWNAQPVPEVKPVLPVGDISAESLRQFLRPGALSLEIEVSFDNRTSWTPFKPASVTLVD